MKHILTIIALSFVVSAHAQTSLIDPKRGTITLSDVQGDCRKDRKVAEAPDGSKGCWRTVKKGVSIKWTKTEKPQHYDKEVLR